ncbi:MAG: tol-pal system protein YbgF [Alphaproteobacteria bacterium]|nr:tol-pal system protein YbgF [Alphaproteobacteria bacterium]
MVRCCVASCCRLLAVGVLIAAALPMAAARAQDRSVQDRLDRIERDLNMLQRQVYRGAPTASVGAPAMAGGATAADVEVRMERLEAQMRELTGRVEQVANGLDQLKQRVEQVNSDLDVRLGEGAAAASPAPPRGSSRTAAAADRFPPAPPPAGGLMPPGTVVPPPASESGGLSPIFNTLTPPGSAPSAPPRLGPPSAEPASAAAGPPRGGSTNDQFNYAFGLVKQADYAGAESALRAFIDAHPNDPLAASAQYWLGQTFYARNRYQDAAAAFAEGYKRSPKGAKAPDDLLYLGLSLAKADQKKNACLALAQLDEAFPNASAAIKKSASAEHKRLGCS